MNRLASPLGCAARGGAAYTGRAEPVCDKSPHHSVVTAAVARA